MTPLSKNCILAYIVIFSIMGSSTGQLYEEEDCHLRNGESGKCKLQSNCPGLRDIIASGKPPVICSFNQSQSIVCCPTNNTSVSKKPDSSRLPEMTRTTSTMSPLSIEEDCHLRNGESGKCKLQSNCPGLRDIIASGKPPVICSFNQSQSIVCCPTNNTSVSKKPDSSRLPEMTRTTSTMSPLSIGSACTMDSGSSGTCQSLQDCPEANTILSGTTPKLCYFKKSTPIVCCLTGQMSVPDRLPPRQQHHRTTIAPETRRTTTSPPSNRTSVAMCEHYAQFVFELELLPILLIVAQSSNESQCNSEVRVNKVALRGVGVARYKEFPHVTRLGYGDENSIEWNCAGSLISEKYILTAALCITSPNSGRVQWARVGDMEPTVYSPNTKDVQRVVEWVTPPGSRASNSLALLRLERNVEFRGYRRPACLYYQPGLPEGYRFATTTGWGMADWNKTTGTTQKLSKQDLPFSSSSQCRQPTRPERRRRRQQSHNRTPEGGTICVTNPAQVGSSDCVGGLGSPLEIVLETPYCMTSILGVNTAGARGCPTSVRPAIFTRVSDHIAWIESTVWP